VLIRQGKLQPDSSGKQLRFPCTLVTVIVDLIDLSRASRYVSVVCETISIRREQRGIDAVLLNAELAGAIPVWSTQRSNQ
jgi:hypothetical protein